MLYWIGGEQSAGLKDMENTKADLSQITIRAINPPTPPGGSRCGQHCGQMARKITGRKA